MISRRWLYAHLLTTGIVLLAWLNPVYAQSIKDIRIGKYDNFTRIVFETDADLVAEEIVSSGPSQLTVVFAKTEPAFVRKIPVDRDPHIERIKVLSHEGRLSITLFLANQHARFDTFGLKAPPRMVLDVFWKLPPGQPVSEIPPKEPVNTPKEKELEKESPSTSTGNASDSLAGMYDRALSDSDIDKRSTSQLKEETIRSTDRGSDAATPRKAVLSKNDAQKALPGRSTDTKGTAAPPYSDSDDNTSRPLQYYLVIALVVITIGILLLLVVMLMFRHQWGDEKRSLKTNEYLQRQDKRIASINARVQEQLKRYDEV